MEATAVLKCGRIHQAHRFDIVLGGVAEVTLSGTTGRIEWSAGDDEVLKIEDDNGPFAKIKGAAIGTSRILLLQGGKMIGELHIEVYQEPTVTVGMKFTNVRDREK